jgi:hypothetical protein
MVFSRACSPIANKHSFLVAIANTCQPFRKNRRLFIITAVIKLTVTLKLKTT